MAKRKRSKTTPSTSASAALSASTMILARFKRYMEKINNGRSEKEEYLQRISEAARTHKKAERMLRGAIVERGIAHRGLRKSCVKLREGNRLFHNAMTELKEFKCIIVSNNEELETAIELVSGGYFEGTIEIDCDVSAADRRKLRMLADESSVVVKVLMCTSSTVFMVMARENGDIGQLFIAGFGYSILFGTIVESLADKLLQPAEAVDASQTGKLPPLPRNSENNGSADTAASERERLLLIMISELQSRMINLTDELTVEKLKYIQLQQQLNVVSGGELGTEEKERPRI